MTGRQPSGKHQVWRSTYSSARPTLAYAEGDCVLYLSVDLCLSSVFCVFVCLFSFFISLHFHVPSLCVKGRGKHGVCLLAESTQSRPLPLLPPLPPPLPRLHPPPRLHPHRLHCYHRYYHNEEEERMPLKGKEIIVQRGRREGVTLWEGRRRVVKRITQKCIRRRREGGAGRKEVTQRRQVRSRWTGNTCNTFNKTYRRMLPTVSKG